ncbi:hypothetical protein CO230_10705 [Chryseobacterium sp. 6424]|uniref:HesA/MoeB/ThiF family protein n=1 Tax=Chryseobacterium sp. 6424 TaxID=2039166 RepID=UPI000EFD7945|nr:HesA/MoeB/ThiF family protein [Chryseobacterium sp. 6424]AYO58542.1 hypothetical protein CO230_10705 [Chryseobacterium sp. 6424]
MQRYSRQIILPNFGAEAQSHLLNSKVLVVGAGGLGIPVLQYLAAAGVGKLGIADGDVIEISNLQRQVLYNETEIGKNKARTAGEKIAKLNSAIKLEVYDYFIDQASVFTLIEGYDVVVDCTDHFSIRYLLNDACSLLKKPLVYASIFQFEAQVSVFHYGDVPYNLRDVFPEIPDDKSVPNCNEAGVIGTLAGITGSLQASEVIKIITKIGIVNSGRMLLFNSLSNQITQLSISKNSKIFLPNSKDEILQKNYGFFCTNAISLKKLSDLEAALRQESAVLIDVREKNELPKISTLSTLEIPLSELSDKIDVLQQFDTLVFICKSGVRSRKALDEISGILPLKQLYHCENGINIFEDEKKFC